MSRSTRWTTSNAAAIDSLLFTGASTLVDVVEGLFRRPSRIRADKPLPVIYLIVPAASPNPLLGIEDRLRRVRRSVTSRLAADHPPTSTREALNRVVADLSTKVKGVAKLRFPHYSLVVWLTTLEPATNEDTQPDGMDRLVDTRLNELIKKRLHIVAGTGDVTDLADQFPLYVRLLARSVPRLAMAAMRLLWRPPRWLEQHEIGTGHGRSFRTLTRAFMGNRQDIDDHARRQLLVDAFLEDLSRAYRRTTVFGRGRRRTSYPVLLADVPEPSLAEAETVVLDLLHRIGTARDKAGQQGGRSAPYRPDPLLVVAAGQQAPVDEQSSAQSIESAANPNTAYDTWLREMEQFSRDRSWFLPLRVPEVGQLKGGERDEITGVPLPRVRRSITALIVLTLIVVGTAGVVVDRTNDHCGMWYWQSNLDRVDDQCVGLAPPEHRFFDDMADTVDIPDGLKENLRVVEDNIHQNNTEIVNSGDNYLTVVYLSQLTPQDIEGYQWELEQLRGIEIAQDEVQRHRPIRVLLANAGNAMDHGGRAAESIVAEARRDDTLVGVLGLGISREGTRDAMIKLGEARIPMIGTFISATPLAEETTEYYHQVGPTNKRESAIAAYYAKTELNAKKVHIYYFGDRRDLYSSDLRDQAEAAFRKQRIEVETSPYKADPGDAGIDLGRLGGQACDIGEDAVAFYAGRAEHLPAFLSGMKGECEERYPSVISGDDATRFVLAKGLNTYPGLALDYLSFGSSLAWGRECGTATKKVGFFVAYEARYEPACDQTRDGSAILAYDSFITFERAVQFAPDHSSGRPTTDGVLAGIGRISESAVGALSGAGGDIDFGKGGHAVPVDKAVMILRATGSDDPTRVILCGQIQTAQPPPDTKRCPPGEN